MYEVSDLTEDKAADAADGVYTFGGDASPESRDGTKSATPAGGDAVVDPPLPDLNDAELEKAAIRIQVAERVRQARRRLMNRDLKRISYQEGVDPHIPKFMIHPEGRFRITWNMLVAFILLYISLAVPLQIGFDVDPEGAWAAFEHVLDAFFFIDLAVNFRTGFIEEESHLVMDEVRSALHYGKSMGFVIDFVTTMPFDHIMKAASGHGNGDDDDGAGNSAKSAQRLLKVARILKAVKMLRLNKLLRGSVLEMYEDLMSSSASVRFFLRVLKVLFALAFTLHWMACGWYLVSDTSKGVDSHQNSWVHVYLGDDGYDDEATAKMNASDRFSLDTRYLAAMYWAATTLTTVGYGDITPQSDAERLFCFFGMIIGGAGYGFLVGECASVVSEVDAHTKQYNERMESIIAYMGQRNFPLTLQRKIKRFYRRYFKQKSALNEQTVLAELSTKLKNEVALFVVNALVVKNPLFVGLSTQSLSEMTALVRPVFYEVDEHMVHMGEEIIDLQVISLGIATVIDSDGSLLCELKPGSSFGAESIMADPNAPDASVPTWNCTVVATQPCECLQIPTEELRALFNGGSHKGVLETIKRNARHNLSDVCITQQAVLSQGVDAISKSLKALIDPNSAVASFGAASSIRRGSTLAPGAPSPGVDAQQGGEQGSQPDSTPVGLGFIKFADVAKRAMAAHSFQNVIAQPTKAKDPPKATDGSEKLKLIEDGVERLSQSIQTQSHEQSARIDRLEQANETLAAALARSEAREEKMLQLLSALSTK